MKKTRVNQKQIDDFTILIEDIKTELNCSYLEAVVEHCSNNDIEFESVAPLIEGTLRLSIGKEANVMNMLKYPRASYKRGRASLASYS